VWLKQQPDSLTDVLQDPVLHQYLSQQQNNQLFSFNQGGEGLDEANGRIH